MIFQHNLTVFYTDDDNEDIEFFKEVTSALPNKPDVVAHSSGSKLLDALHNPPPHPHIVFLDLNMPGINGFEVLKKVRANDSLSNLPVVIFTTSSDDRTIEKSRDLGANFFLPKSSSYPELKKSIEHALNIDWTSFNPNREQFVYAHN